ncbi:hypothetical protein [Streptomyces pseudovenezuelae]|uniref:hypothetical protein n=1 Tax=Streptomyces pseudovenezuelae TaxID=67350 RepID=UPI003722BA3A
MTAYEKDPGPRTPRTHLSAAGLRARGWTAGMIRRLLGEPDLRRPNPFLRTAPPTRLYSVERVAAAERSEEFRAVSAVAARRPAAMQEAARRRRRKVLARIAAESTAMPAPAPPAISPGHPDRAQQCEHRRGPEIRGPEIQVRSRPPAPDDRKVVRRPPQEFT